MLSALIWLPVIGALAITLLPQSQSKKGAIIVASAILILDVLLLKQFDTNLAAFQLSENLPWLENIGLNYSLGVDGLSLPLVALNGLLTWLIICFCENQIKERFKLFQVLMLLIHAGVSGAMLSTNTLLFVLFYELVLIPLYLIIAVWGGLQRSYAAMKFLIFTAVSGILILAGFLALGWLTANPTPIFDYSTLQTLSLPLEVQITLLVVLLLGFSIKAPFVPFHSWLPDTYVESATPTVMMLGGIVAKLGTYGLFRFCVGLFPDAWALLAPYIAIWAGLGVLYGAMVAISQKDIKRMVAYSSIGHMSYILLAAAAATPLSLIGGIGQMVSHGLVLALLFYLVGVIEEKVGTRDLDLLNGLLNPLRGLPTTSALLILGGMASAGIPGLVGFIAEFLVFQGTFTKFPIPTIFSIIGTGLTAVYFVILLNRTCFGKLDNATAYYPKVSGLEQLPALILTGLIIFLGVQPVWLVKWSEKATVKIAEQSESKLLVSQVLNESLTSPLIKN
ncbi:MAG: NADH-quinone oxidoreductase subunit M [Pseudanabaena sp.]|jgi:NAD(P)H-quinone oxidoreductase subunit 4|uniref:NADH-quinone oxidoreductase subunit M n=1 Tax=Pseudanabaena mucicola TaxID=71190 RepID=UPI002575B6F7|nr:NADH-quinone oxidoreductase subunit M [Pseudanabaena mucicola]MCA6573198.1 NADH-quinone oxidoreductase subunit M [Pseudanabaena sp. M53BS1SP1A06MG]MCA6583894.1 NADH-quinone oxidoreductase subunit M [Pseudanabaena sp. M34BS1SP1A06MG]MCA6589646.1 NADH-quinone oxidoreductase subunit M [Pseudanabaena sp. M109S1SP1A06QC]MCA6591882.1 NADH-quinone oxidoreductase subunit M [Pseudanabaena sp. M38BS1SP1A06MG]MCA6596064.1 NADH-quinone oxidoreductase subunit M [Pseudanabaena sp. M046S1SP1A06QC]MCA6600